MKKTPTISSWFFQFLLICGYSVFPILNIECLSYSYDAEINNQVIKLDLYPYKSYTQYMTRTNSQSYNFTIEPSITSDGIFILVTYAPGDVVNLCNMELGLSELRKYSEAFLYYRQIKIEITPKKYHYDYFGKSERNKKSYLDEYYYPSGSRITSTTIGAITFTMFSDCSDSTRTSRKTLKSCSKFNNKYCIAKELFCDKDINCLSSDDPSDTYGFDEHIENCEWKYQKNTDYSYVSNHMPKMNSNDVNYKYVPTLNINSINENKTLSTYSSSIPLWLRVLGICFGAVVLLAIVVYRLLVNSQRNQEGRRRALVQGIWRRWTLVVVSPDVESGLESRVNDQNSEHRVELLQEDVLPNYNTATINNDAPPSYEELATNGMKI